MTDHPTPDAREADVERLSVIMRSHARHGTRPSTDEYPLYLSHDEARVFADALDAMRAVHARLTDPAWLAEVMVRHQPCDGLDEENCYCGEDWTPFHVAEAILRAARETTP